MAPTKDEGVEKKDPAQTKEEIILELPKETTERSKGYHPPPEPDTGAYLLLLGQFRCSILAAGLESPPYKPS